MALPGSVTNVVCFILIYILTTSNISRVHGQDAEGENQIPPFQDLGSIMGLVGNGMNPSNIISKINQPIASGDPRDYRPKDPLIDVFVETKSVDELMASDEGKQRMGQLEAELKHSMNSLHQGLHLEQHFQRTEKLLKDPKSNTAGRQQGGQSNAQLEQVLNFFERSGRIEQQFEKADQMMKKMITIDTGKQKIGQEIGQLNVQLENAKHSLNDGVRMTQQMKQAQKMEGLLPSLVESGLGGIVNVLTEESSWEAMLQGFIGRQSLQAVGQVRQAMNQFPILENVINTVHRLLQKTEPSTSKNVQQLLAAFDLFLGRKRESMPGTGGITQMMDLALTSLKDNVEMLNAAIRNALTVTRNPTFVQTAKNIQCLTKSLFREETDSGLAQQCMHSLLQAVASMENSEEMLATLTESLSNLLSNPALLRSFVVMLKTSNLDTAFTLMHTVLGNFSTADENQQAIVQTFRAVMRDMLQDQHLIEEMKNLVRMIDTSSVLEYSMKLLKNATAGDPESQQLLLVVNDTIVSAWTGSGDLEQAVEKLREVIVTLNDTQDPSQPVSQTQQAFLNLFIRLMDIVVDAYREPDQGTTRHPGLVTTAKPTAVTRPITIGTTAVSTTSTVSSTSTVSTTSTQPSTSAETSRHTTVSSTTTTTTSATTEEVDGDDATEDGDNGEARISWSGFCLTLALCVFKTLV